MEGISLKNMSSIRLMNRTDKKYVTSVRKLLILLEKAKDKYYCQEIEGRRISTYRTIYFDDPKEHCFYHKHHAGHKPRMKIRTRSYLDTNITFLEIKRKNNRGKTSKRRQRVSSIHNIIEKLEGNNFLLKETNITLNDIIPTVGNHFNRITLVNKEKTERLTIDINLQFDNLENKRNANLEEVCIIELKRDGRCHSPILHMLRDLRIHSIGFSKYLIGSALTNPKLKNNFIKPRLIKICKAANIPIIRL